MKIGEKLVFGEYEWRILDIQEDRILILAEEIIEQRDYHNKPGDVTWKECELRKYLNGEFYDSFSEKDRTRIIETLNKNPDNPWYESKGGQDTVDKIFLLSLDDVVKKYFGDSSKLLDERGSNQRYCSSFNIVLIFSLKPISLI